MDARSTVPVVVVTVSKYAVTLYKVVRQLEAIGPDQQRSHVSLENSATS